MITMQINEEGNKVSVLISALEERYQSLRVIRERVQSTGFWALGLLLGSGGWLIKEDPQFSALEKAFFITGLALVFIVLRFSYLQDLNKGFKSQQKTTAKIEEALGLFHEGIFIQDSIYPQNWANAGNEKGEGKFFKTTYLLLYIGFLFLAFSILLSGSEKNAAIPINHSHPREIREN